MGFEGERTTKPEPEKEKDPAAKKGSASNKMAKKKSPTKASNSEESKAPKNPL
jgi:hypothetical protein